MTKIDETETAPVRSPKQTRGVRIAAAVGAFVLVLVVLGVIGLIANGGGSEVVDTPPTTPTTDAVPVAESFFTAFLRGDWDAANKLAQGVLIGGENGNLLWEVDVVGTDCELVTEFLVECTSTQTDALTRQVSAAHAWESVGTMLVVDGVVTWYTSEILGPPFHDQYEEWLDTESPDGWLFSECTHGGYLVAGCLPIYLANVEAWLATDPDLSDIEG